MTEIQPIPNRLNVPFFRACLSGFVVLTMSGFPAITLGAEACKTTTPAWRSMNQVIISMATISGSIFELPVRIANNTHELRGGYQWLCKETVRNSAILFVQASSRITRFHMNNVFVPLDIFYFDNDGKLIESLEMPREKQNIPGQFKTYAPNQAFKFALELPRSSFSRFLSQADRLYLTSGSISTISLSP